MPVTRSTRRPSRPAARAAVRLRRGRSPAVACALAAVTLACGGAGSGSPGGGGEWAAERTTVDGVTTVRTLSGSVWGGTARLEEELSIGVEVGEDPYMFGRIDAVAATDSEIYVVDGDVPAVRVYDRSGEHLRDLGAEGEGPGEFTQPDKVALGEDGVVHVHDAAGSRITLFTPEGELIDTWGMESGTNFVFRTGTPMVITADGTVWVPGRVDAGAGLDTVRTGMVPRGPAADEREPVVPPAFDYQAPTLDLTLETGGGGIMRMRMGIPYTPTTVWTLSPTGALVAGLSTDYRFEIRYPDGGRTVVEKAWEPIPVDPAEAAWHRERITAQMRSRSPEWTWEGPELPATRPAYDAFVADHSGRAWVRRPGPGIHDPGCDPDPSTAVEMGRPCWRDSVLIDVFDLEGRYLGDVELPDGVTFDARGWIRGDRLLLVGEDDAGVTSLKGYRLVLPTPAG